MFGANSLIFWHKKTSDSSKVSVNSKAKTIESPAKNTNAYGSADTELKSIDDGRVEKLAKLLLAELHLHQDIVIETTTMEEIEEARKTLKNGIINIFKVYDAKWSFEFLENNLCQLEEKCRELDPNTVFIAQNISLAFLEYKQQLAARNTEASASNSASLPAPKA